MDTQTDPVPSRIPIDYVTFRLDVIVSLAKADASAVYEKACGVSLRELRCLRIATFEPGLPQSRLAAQSYVEKTLVSKTITGLVRRGLLRREIDARDARRVRLYATEAGSRVVDTCETLGRALEGELLAGIPSQQRVSFGQCMDVMMANLADMLRRRPPEPRARNEAANPLTGRIGDVTKTSESMGGEPDGRRRGGVRSGRAGTGG